MQEVLLRKLIEKNYFKNGTEIDATYRGVDLSGAPVHTFEQTFTITGIFETRKTKRILIDCFSTVDGRTIRVPVDAIVNIDGMTPERFAENYMIDENGGDIKPSGKRRGRRPKGWVDPDLAIDADDEDELLSNEG
jgi:hypothetical protein